MFMKNEMIVKRMLNRQEAAILIRTILKEHIVYDIHISCLFNDVNIISL